MDKRINSIVELRSAKRRRLENEMFNIPMDQ